MPLFLTSVTARWRWFAPLTAIVIISVANLRHPRPASIIIATGFLLGTGVLSQLTRNHAEQALRDRTFGRSPAAWLHVITLAGLFASSAALGFLERGASGPVALFIALMMSTRLLPMLASVILGPLVASVVGLSEVGTHGSLLDGVLSGFLFAAFFAIILLATSAREGSEQAGRMEQRAIALAERQRVAREMHDVLAHSLSGLMLQLEGARMLAKENPADPRLPEIIERAHHLGKTGLAEARHAIGMLRDDELPGPEQLKVLVEQFERDSGIRGELTVSGTEHELDSEARLAIYRVAQEALTNVRKHASPDRVDVRLVYGRDRTCLTVEDFGTVEDQGTGGAAATPPAVKLSGGGYGLTGMRERAELLGGSLTTGPTSHGFRVELEVPS
jgi:signal transduction histidine kinase